MNKSKLKRMKRESEETQRTAVERGYAKALQQSRKYFRVVDESTELRWVDHTLPMLHPADDGTGRRR